MLHRVGEYLDADCDLSVSDIPEELLQCSLQYSQLS